jgi:hypothetical protein
MNKKEEELQWFRVADVDELPEGRVKTVSTWGLKLKRRMPGR